ncbi:class I SAM-dependent RNA methyltransferase [Ruminococcaceae bacterium OttesenSCG-928-L11]|nr:class I SAM-dependent RNA methyltransferase [Ruminococcaceae bacterium OttesenSCG-928-L11]
MQQLTITAPCLFGLESIVGHEARAIGGDDVTVADGRVTFTGDEAVLARANLWMRTAERVCVVLGTFEARSFEELFDNIVQLPFEAFIGRKDAFPVKGWSLKSGLHSIPDCQSIIKRAAVKRLEQAYGQAWFEETGAVHQIRFSILKDVVTVMLDSSGIGLHKRGYRQNSTEAPIKETLAAGIADLARIRPDDTVYDPMCGSGTLLIESALRAFRIAPGVRRKFAAESWSSMHRNVWEQERKAAIEAINRDAKFHAHGFDIDPEAIRLTKENADKAAVGKRVSSLKQDIDGFAVPDEPAIVLCNPPYGERLLEIREAEELYRRMGKVFARHPQLKLYIISPHEQFESFFGRRADKKRKLYNGMIKCQLFMYYK